MHAKTDKNALGLDNTTDCQRSARDHLSTLYRPWRLLSDPTWHLM